jgi:hypothetical protein
LEDVRRLYNLILGRREERVAIALKRLNSCMTRDDAVDAILDATIGLEVLLGDQKIKRSLTSSAYVRER